MDSQSGLPLGEKSNQNWLKSILLKYGRPIFERCVYFYARLGALPRQTRLYLRRTVGVSLTTLALALAFSNVPLAMAATITVNGDGTAGTCSLADAITAANNNAISGNCLAGNDAAGFDIINLQTDVVLSNALPSITSGITLNGNNHTIDGNNGNFAVLSVIGGSLTLNSATITGANNTAAPGGGIYNSGTLILTNSTISGNYSYYNGGGIYNYQGTVTISNSTITNNYSYNRGGGMDNLVGTVTISNSTISDNSALIGGGVENTGSATFNNSTITGNTAFLNGGGLRNIGFTAPSTITLNHTIISGNVAPSGSEIYQDSLSSTPTLTANNYNLIGQNSGSGITTNAGTFNYGGNGDIVAPVETIGQILDTTLADNGGPTPTHALLVGSPAIDHVPDGTSTAGIDQRGAARDADGDGAASAAEGDIGAFEWRPVEESCLPALTTGVDITIDGVVINVTNLGTLSCVKVEDMGAVNHLIATPGIQTGRWWHIFGEDSGGNRVTSGFDLAIELPYAAADADSRVCKYPGNLGGGGWDCDDGTNTTVTPNTSVRRTNITSFSDFAVGQGVAPTAVQLRHAAAAHKSNFTFAALLSSLTLALGTAWAALRRKRLI